MIHKNKSQKLLENLSNSNIMITFPSLETILFSMFSVTILMILIRIITNANTKRNLPPSPPRLPVIGNLHQLGSNPNRSLQTLSHRYGPIMLLHFGSVPTIVASSSDVAKEIMKTHDISFSSRPSLRIADLLLYGSKNIAFSPYGEYWRQLKSIAVLHLLSSTRVKSFRQVREKEISVLIETLGETRGCLVDMGSLLSSLTNNITCKVSLGRTYDSVKLVDLLNKYTKLFSDFSVGTYIPWLSWIDRLSGLEGRAKDVAKDLDEFLEGVIEDHVNQKTEYGDSEDLVHILLNVQKDDTTGFTLHKDSIKAVILDMISAGTETTSTSLEWTISELLKHPRVMKTLQREVREIAQGRSMIHEEYLEKMQYLKAVIKESLRLHPPLPILLPRKSTADIKLMGYDIPSGTQVIVNASVIGRDPAKWDESNEFRPERFLNNSIDYKGLNFGWLPFGAGRRGCPGIQFSVAVMELALANVIYKFDLTLPNGLECADLDMSEIFGITLHRKSSLMVRATPTDCRS